MLFYIIAFIILIFLFHQASKHSLGESSFWFPYLLFVLFASTIEGCRDLTIGTDLNVYGILYFDDAHRSHYLIKHIFSYGGEWGFHAFMWLCSCLSSDIHVMLFVSALVKIVLVSISFLRMRKLLNPTLLMFSYLCFSYVTGFNIMRQALAASVAIFALPYLLRKRWLPYFVLSILAMTIHSSAFMTLILAVLYFATKMKGGLWISFIVLGGVYTLASAIMVYIMMSDIGLYSDKAALYLEREGVTTAKTNIVIACLYIVFIFKNKSHLMADKFFEFFLLLSITALFFTLMSAYFEVAIRLSWYVLYLLGFMYALAIKNMPYRKIHSFAYVVIFFMYFIIDAMHGLGDCLPYKSNILGI